MDAAENALVGWYDDPTQIEPSHEPPRDAPCLFCGFRIGADDVRTHSLMYASQYAARSYFYRTHRTCDEAESPIAMDSFVLDLIKRMESLS